MVENGRKVEEAACLCREKAHVDTQEIRWGADEEAEAAFAGVQERLASVEGCEKELNLHEQIHAAREEVLADL
jgi:hypothetical protein